MKMIHKIPIMLKRRSIQFGTVESSLHIGGFSKSWNSKIFRTSVKNPGFIFFSVWIRNYRSFVFFRGLR